MSVVALVLGVSFVIVFALAVALDYENGRQRQERHDLKNKLHAALLLLEKHGIDYPDEWRRR